MASEKIQGAAGGAAAGAKIGSVVPGVGTAIGAAVGAVIGALSSKGTYAQDKGYEIAGELTPQGFKGTVVGLSENAGEQYRNAATGELFYLNATAADRWKKYGLTDADAPIPFSGTIPYDFNIAFNAVEEKIQAAAASKGSGLLDALRGNSAQIAAPAVSGVQPGGPQPATGSAPTIAAGGDAPAVRVNWPGLLALASGLFWVVKNV